VITSPSTSPVTLHVGLPKCASTFLQAHVFRRHPDVQFLGIYRPVHETDDEGAEEMRGAPAYDYLLALKSQEILAFDQARLDTMMPPCDPGKVAVISDEDLSFPDKVDRAEKARRLHASFPQARVMFVLRNPASWVESWYLFEMRKFARFSPFDEWMSRNWTKFERSLLRVLRYRELIETYAGLFGRDRLDILLLEDLEADQAAFVDAVCRRLGVDPSRLPVAASSASENVRMPSVMFGVARSMPWLYDLRGLVPPRMRIALRQGLYRFGGKAKVEIPPHWRNEIAARFGGDLAYLAERYNLPLRERGYPVA
jgi:hypothetical protein